MFKITEQQAQQAYDNLVGIIMQCNKDSHLLDTLEIEAIKVAVNINIKILDWHYANEHQSNEGIKCQD